MRVALVHDWLTGRRGGEKCLESLCRLYPGADLYTLLYAPGSTSSLIENRQIKTSFLQHLPGIVRWYRLALPLMPLAISRLRLRRRYDLVVSLSHAVAKSIVPPPEIPHVCYCFTPMRYAWHLYHDYFERGSSQVAGGVFPDADTLSRMTGGLRRRFFSRLRRWDRRTAERVTHFVAISRTVEQRIQEAYGRRSHVIYPPVDTTFYGPGPEQREDFYLCVSALAPYKHIDLAIRACATMDRRLVIIGKGPEAEKLRRMAGPTVQFLGWQPDEVVRDHQRRCRALLFPGREDFGIVPVEAQACGTPVIAFGEGGACESLIPATSDKVGTGIFFDRQDAASLAAAMGWYEAHLRQFCEQTARQQALRFNTQRYENEMASYLEAVVSGRFRDRRPEEGDPRRFKIDAAHPPGSQRRHRRRGVARDQGADFSQEWQPV